MLGFSGELGFMDHENGPLWRMCQRGFWRMPCDTLLDFFDRCIGLVSFVALAKGGVCETRMWWGLADSWSWFRFFGAGEKEEQEKRAKKAEKQKKKVEEKKNSMKVDSGPGSTVSKVGKQIKKKSHKVGKKRDFKLSATTKAKAAQAMAMEIEK